MKDPPEHGSAAIIIRGARLLTDNQYKVLKALVSHYDNVLGLHYVDFRTLSRQTKLPRRPVRLACRALARQGLAHYAHSLFNEDGQVAGAGYAATTEGRVVCEVKADGGRQDLPYGGHRKAATARRRLHSSD